MNEKKTFSLYGFFIWFLAILFFVYEFFLRVLPATVASNIIHSLDMNLEQFAFIGSAYYLTYSFMQIPVGILLDRFPVRVLVTSALALCSLGTFWFSFAYGFIPAFIARLMVGLGSSFGFVSLILVTLNWFPRKHFAFLVGCGQFVGALGPLCAGGPIALILRAVHGDWRIIFFWVALFGFALTVLMGFFIKGKPVSTDSIVFVDKKDPLKKRLLMLLSRPQVWWTLVYAGTIYVTLPLLGAFWGTSYLESRGLEKASAAFIISMVWIGLAIGSPLFGRISDKIKRRKPIISLCAALGVATSLVFLFTPEKNEYFLGILFFLIGLAGSGQNLSFAIICEHGIKSLRATALGLNNTAIMGFAAIVPPIVTSVIRHFSKNSELTEFAFEQGLLVIPVCFSIAFLVALFGIRETFCRQQNEIHKVEKI